MTGGWYRFLASEGGAHACFGGGGTHPLGSISELSSAFVNASWAGSMNPLSFWIFVLEGGVMNVQIVIFRRYRLEPGSLQEEFKCWIQMLDTNVGLWFVWPRIAPSRVSVTVHKLIWALTDGSHRSMLLGCINCDSEPAAVNLRRRRAITRCVRVARGGRARSSMPALWLAGASCR